MRRLHTDEAGLAGTVLVIVIAWALAAVLMLTGTLIAARQIDDRVASITGSVSEIDDDLDLVELAGQVSDKAAAIDQAAAPLSGQLDQVIGAAGNIDTSARSILDTAGQINQTAGSINSTAGQIGSTVDSIHGHAGGILDTARSIEAGVAAINGRADTIIGLVRGIKADTGDILVAVVEGVHPHANSIDCSPAVTGSRCGAHAGD